VFYIIKWGDRHHFIRSFLAVISICLIHKLEKMKTNSEIQEKVMEELRWIPSLQATEIGVAVQDGIVTLSGYVDHYAMKTAAERAAKSIKGVRAVAQKIEVRSHGCQRTDEDIAWAILNAFEWNSEIPQDLLQVQVQKGVVTLEGEVDWYCQKVAAEKTVHNLLGVIGITNLITLKHKVSAADIKAKIIKALERNTLLDAASLVVATAANQVTLRGKVHSWAQREAAEKAAWSAPGVLEVSNKIKVVDALVNEKEEATKIYL
jgi:osmotically-inducible protein OsmY